MAAAPHGADEPLDEHAERPAPGPADDPAASPAGAPDGAEAGPPAEPADAGTPGAAARAGRADDAPARFEAPADDAQDDPQDDDARDGDGNDGHDRHDGHDGTQEGDGPDDIEARWQQIVAELGPLGEPTAPTREAPQNPRRRASDLPTPAEPGQAPHRTVPEDPASDAGAASDRPGPGARTVRPAGPVDVPRSWSPDPAVEEAEEHFVPPDPGPVLGGDPLLTMAWSAVVGVPILLLVAVVLWQDMPAAVLQAAGVAFAASLALLVWRMPHRRGDDDDGPGAVV